MPKPSQVERFKLSCEVEAIHLRPTLDTPDYENELPRAREQFKAHKQQLAKKREREAKRK